MVKLLYDAPKVTLVGHMNVPEMSFINYIQKFQDRWELFDTPFAHIVQTSIEKKVNLSRFSFRLSIVCVFQSF